MAVVEALTLVSQLDATLVEDGLKHLGAVALDGRVESAVTGIAHTLADTDECVPCLIQVIGTTGCLGKVEQHLGITHGDEGLTVACESTSVCLEDIHR